MEFQTAYGEKVHNPTMNNEPTKTKQALKDDADVNKLIKKYNQVDLAKQAHDLEAIYGQIDSMDLQDAMNKVNAAEEAFMNVPSEIRGQFNNDPGAWIDFATNEENLEQMRQWGFAPPLEPVEEPQPIEVTVVNPPSE